jgi:biopolymer transport protein TolR
MRSTPDGPIYSEMNVTPFIDVLLVLLVIFMMLNSLERTTLRAQVPPPAVSPGITMQLVLELPAAGAYAINGQPIPPALLEPQLRSIFDNREPSVLFLMAAPTRRYDEVIRAMDIARGAGVQVVALMPVNQDAWHPPLLHPR